MPANKIPKIRMPTGLSPELKAKIAEDNIAVYENYCCLNGSSDVDWNKLATHLEEYIAIAVPLSKGKIKARTKKQVLALRRGICEYIPYTYPGSIPIVHIVDKLAKLWPKYSGNGGYPIPSPYKKRRGLVEVFNTAVKTDAMLTGEYGRLRIQLAKFLLVRIQQIAEIDKEAKEAKEIDTYDNH